jgi:DNA-directed RNA polymerase subunit F
LKENDMLEKFLDEANRATHEYEEQKAEYFIQELVKLPDEAIKVLVKALRQPDKIRQAVAIRIICLIGYPKNESAIPSLVYHIGDQNLPGWGEAVQTLTDIGPNVVVPYLIRAMWDRNSHQYWGDDVEGICNMLTFVDRAYAVACGPTLVYILGRSDLPLDKGFLLDVLEKIGAENVTYALPTLFDLASREGTSEVGKQTWRLIQSFSEETLEPYKFLLESIAEKPERNE